MATYRIERNTDGHWSHDGLGDSTGYESDEAAHAAIDSLANINSDGQWTGRYRIVNEQTGAVEGEVSVGDVVKMRELFGVHVVAMDLVVVRLNGGNAENATDAVCLDLEGCGWVGARPSYEWRALVRSDRLATLLHNTGATQVGDAEPWDGEAFGDGNGGTVSLVDGRVQGQGLYEPALA